MIDSDLLRRAIAEFEAGRTEAAEAECRRILRRHPNHAEALQVAALCAARLGRRPEALALLERAVELAPGNAQYHYNLGVTLQELGLADEAMLAYQACLRLQPDHADALWNYGDLLRLNEHFERAVACFERLVAFDRSYPELQHRLGVALHGLEQDERAAAAFEKALAEPGGDKALTSWEYCHVLLTLGRFAEGWDAYDQRFAAGYRTTVSCHPFPQPLWRGEDLKGRSLLIHGEQGLGDEIMFASIVPELIEEGARVILACQPPLARLFAASFPAASVRAHQALSRPADVSDLEPIDYQITFGSLPGRRRRNESDFARNGPYLKADPDRAARFRARLAELAPAARHKLKVGLTWGSNPATGVDWGQRRARHKSVPLDLLKPLSTLTDRVQFVSLQNRDLGPQAADAPWLDLVDFHRELLDLADTAALIESLDLVISVDTSIAHLAGAMGKPVWILLMRRADWRWLRGTEQSVWYPSARLFRQEVQGEWRPVLERVVRELAALPAPRVPEAEPEINRLFRLLASGEHEAALRGFRALSEVGLAAGRVTRTTVVQRLLAGRPGARYLEIGVESGINFLQVEASLKFAVDPEFRIPGGVPVLDGCRFFAQTSDEFFAAPPTELVEQGIDAVLVDGLHTWAQALRDVENCLRYLRPGGVIVMHDCLPASAAEAAPSLAQAMATPGYAGNWTGDVYKAVVQLRALRPDLFVAVLDADHGLGLVCKGEPEGRPRLGPAEIGSLDYERLCAAPEALLNLKPARWFDTWLAGR